MIAATEDELLALARGFVQLFLEVESGRRPRTTVEPYMAPHLIDRLGANWVRGGPPRRAGTARGCATGPDTFEAAVTARGGGRHGVVMVRLERLGRGWRVTETGRPEDGPLPPPALDVLEWESSIVDLVPIPPLVAVVGPSVVPVPSPAAPPPLPVAVGL